MQDTDIYTEIAKKCCGSCDLTPQQRQQVKALLLVAAFSSGRDWEKRIAELQETAQEGNFELPLLPEAIVALEELGCTVELPSGEINIDGADTLVRLVSQEG